MLWLGCVNCYTQTLMNASMLTPAWRIPSVITQKAAMNAFVKLDLKKARLGNASVSIPLCSLRASSPVWAGKASLARTRERGASAPRGFASLRFARPNRKACSQATLVDAVLSGCGVQWLTDWLDVNGDAFSCARSEEGETQRRDTRLHSWRVSRAPRPLCTSFVWKNARKK